MLLILGFSSDYTRWRFPFVALGFLFTFIGFVIFANVDIHTELHVAYFACFMMTWGTSAPSVILGKYSAITRVFQPIQLTSTCRCLV